MIKRILRKVFPRILLKDAFLAYNKLKIHTWDKLFFSEEVISSDKFLVKEEKNPFLEANVPVNKFPSEALEKLSLWQNPEWKQDQYFLHYRETGYLEPQYGWAVSSSQKLVYPSLGFSRAEYVRKPSFLDMYINKRKTVYLSRIISLRDTGEQNYFHFYNDVLAKLFYAEDKGINLNDFTIVISKNLFDKEYFQFFHKNTRLKACQFYIQEQEWVCFDEGIFCKPYTHTKKYLDAARGLIQYNLASNGSKRIFLTRSQRTMRFIENMNELNDIIEKSGFKIIDSEALNLSQQIALFSQTEFLISIHGAGLTNMIFRKGRPLNILEIFHPFDYIPFHYMMLAHIYGFRYQLLLGNEGRRKQVGGFRVSPHKFKKMIEDFVGTNN